MAEQTLKKLSPHERYVVRLTTDTNRRAAENYRREQQRKQGKNVCTWCGAEPCGHLWTRPGDGVPDGERCCDRCSHRPVEAWQHTHTAWDGAVPYAVCAVRMKEGDVVYMRRDGVMMFLEMQAPAPFGPEGATVPTVAFLGEDGGAGLYTAGEGGPEHVNLWEKKRELDVLWLTLRAGAAVAHDEARKRALAAQLAAEDAEWQKKEEARRAEEKAKLAASIEKKQLAHETRVVMDEIDIGGDGEELDAVEVPIEAAPEPAAEPEAVRLSRAELKKPVPVKKGPGRPKRSARQRDARQRQKRAWARQEAAARLEVKRLERLSRKEGESLVKEDE